MTHPGRCCNVLLFPPLEWDFPVYNANKIEVQNPQSSTLNTKP